WPWPQWVPRSRWTDQRDSARPSLYQRNLLLVAGFVAGGLGGSGRAAALLDVETQLGSADRGHRGPRCVGVVSVDEQEAAAAGAAENGAPGTPRPERHRMQLGDPL